MARVFLIVFADGGRQSGRYIRRRESEPLSPTEPSVSRGCHPRRKHDVYDRSSRTFISQKATCGRERERHAVYLFRLDIAKTFGALSTYDVIDRRMLSYERRAILENQTGSRLPLRRNRVGHGQLLFMALLRRVNHKIASFSETSSRGCAYLPVLQCDELSKQSVSSPTTDWQQIRAEHVDRFIDICVPNLLLFCRQRLLTDPDSRLMAESEQDQYVPFKYIEITDPGQFLSSICHYTLPDICISASKLLTEEVLGKICFCTGLSI